jgi:hypothetical protein
MMPMCPLLVPTRRFIGGIDRIRQPQLGAAHDSENARPSPLATLTHSVKIFLRDARQHARDLIAT